MNGGDARAWNEGDFTNYFPGMPIHYRSKWYVLRGHAPIMFGVGVFGQNVFIDRKNQIVIAKFSVAGASDGRATNSADHARHRGYAEFRAGRARGLSSKRMGRNAIPQVMGRPVDP